MSYLSDYIATGTGGGTGGVVTDAIVSDISAVTGSNKVENIIYGTAAPPDPLPNGTIYIQVSG